MTKPFKVALVALDGNTVPAWVKHRFAEQGVDFVARECIGRDALRQTADDADVVWVFGSHQCLTAANLDVIGACRGIIRTGSGTDNVPVAEATARGIVVANTPDALTDSVSDHAIALLFAVCRQIAVQDRAVRSGVWDRDVARPNLHLSGRTLGLVGFGRIARMVARKLRGFELRVIAYDPLADPALFAAAGVEAVDLDALLATSDVVSLHCPLTPETHHLLNARRLGLMKPHAILVNTARGPIIDEAALVQALREQRLAGAGLDVMEDEPPPHSHPLYQLNNVVLTPHIAAYSDEYLAAMWQLSVESALDLAAGRWPRSVVNPQVEPRVALVRD